MSLVFDLWTNQGDGSGMATLTFKVSKTVVVPNAMESKEGWNSIEDQLRAEVIPQVRQELEELESFPIEAKRIYEHGRPL